MTGKSTNFRYAVCSKAMAVGSKVLMPLNQAQFCLQAEQLRLWRRPRNGMRARSSTTTTTAAPPPAPLPIFRIPGRHGGVRSSRPVSGSLIEDITPDSGAFW